MAFKQTISYEIEINCSPEQVREVLLDFPKYAEWHKSLTITPVKQNAKGIDLQPGDRLQNNFDGTAISPVIVENTPSTFQWRGSFYGLVVGRHQFYLSSSTQTSGGTTFVQTEDFAGALAWMFAPNRGYGAKTADEFRSFNDNLKARAESLYPRS